MKTITQLQKELRKVSDSHRRVMNQRFFKTGKGQYGEGDMFVGITMPDIRMVIKDYNDLPINEIHKMVSSPFHEFRMAGLLILVSQFEKGDEKVKKTIFNYFLKNTKYINNWDLVDVTIPRVVGMWLLNHDRSVLYKLVKSKNMWERRIAVLATFPFIRNKDFKDIINVAELLLNDKEDLMHKAVGWMLREVGKKDVTVLEKFLNKHHKVMPRTMLRYSIERMPEAKRKHYMKK